MSVATVAHALFSRWPGTPAADTGVETGGPKPRAAQGPLLMGDIHGSLGGRPVLLILWDRWDRGARDPPD